MTDAINPKNELPENYHWLEGNPLVAASPLVSEALSLYGTHEAPGTADNPEILGWAKELGIKDYTHDAEPWCGLFMAYVATKAGETLIPAKPLWALNWANFGNAAPKPGFGDVLVFQRFNPLTKKLIGGHVGLYIGEDQTCFHVLGGNESDAVTITRIPKTRLKAARRSIRIEKADPILLPPTGQLSQNEA